MIWDSVVLKAVKFKEFEGYEMSLLDMTFDVMVSMINDQNSRAELNQLLNTALTAGMITYEQAFKVKNIEDTKLAELYLARAMKRARKEAEESAQKNAQMNAQIQQESAMASAQSSAQLTQMEAESKIAVNRSKGESDKEVELIRFASTIYANALSSGRELPQEIKVFADTILGNAIRPQVQQAQMEAQMQQQEMAGQMGGEMGGEMEEVETEQVEEQLPEQ